MKHHLLLTTALLTGLILSAPAMAQDAAVYTNTTTKVTRPMAITGDTKEVKPAIQRFVERVNMARLALAKSNPKEALNSINEADKHMRFIKKNSNYQEITKQTVVSSGEVVYDNNATTYNSYYVPLEEGPVLIKDYTSAENQSGKGQKNAIALKSARVVYLTVDMSGNEIENALGTARNLIKQGDLSGADDTLGKMLEDVTVADSVQQRPEIVAKDNLALALGFLENNNYVASRFALLQAEDALQKMKKDDKYNIDKVDAVHSRVSQISDLVMQQNEGTASKARTQIKAAQKEMADLS